MGKIRKGISKLVPEFVKKAIRKPKDFRDFFHYKNEIKELLQSDRKIFLFCVCEHRNIGDQAIYLAETDYMKGIVGNNIPIIPIPDRFDEWFLKTLKNKVGVNDLVAIHGGGFLGSIWKNERYEKIINAFNGKKIIVLPQTIFYENNAYGIKRLKKEKNLFKKENLTVFVREENSFEFAQHELVGKEHNNFVLVPDIVLSYKTDVLYAPEKKVTFCLRSDKEKVTTQYFRNNAIQLLEYAQISFEETDMVANIRKINLDHRRNYVEEKMRQFAQSKFVVTDRLHCMIFCTLVGTPCIAMDNSSKKVKGVYEKWLKNLDYIVFCENENDALSKAEEWIKSDSIKATRYSPKDLESAFAPLTRAIKDCLA